MTIIAVDDEHLQLSRLRNSIIKACPDAELVSYENPIEAKEWIEANRPDVAFLDIEMPGLTGTMLAEFINKRYANVNVIFVTAFPEYAKEAFDLRASGYVTKPVNPDKIATELANLRHPVRPASVGIGANSASAGAFASTESSEISVDSSASQPAAAKLKVVCFGDFDVLWNGTPLAFKRQKTLELFAYLIDKRGSRSNVNEICSVLWEDSDDDTKNKSYLRHLVNDLSKTLASINQNYVFRRERNNYSIDPSAIDCDFYDYLEGKEPAVSGFTGKYMARYSWAEDTLATLL